MPKLEDFNSFFIIDDHRFINGDLNYFVGSEGEVSIYYGRQPHRILYKGHYNEWTDLNDNEYSSLGLLISDLDKFMLSDELLDKLAFAERNGDNLLKVTNVKSGDVLKDILTELKITNFHLSIITENKIDEINT
jgi:hypothetical protein